MDDKTQVRAWLFQLLSEIELQEIKEASLSSDSSNTMTLTITFGASPKEFDEDQMPPKWKCVSCGEQYDTEEEADECCKLPCDGCGAFLDPMKLRDGLCDYCHATKESDQEDEQLPESISDDGSIAIITKEETHE